MAAEQSVRNTAARERHPQHFGEQGRRLRELQRPLRGRPNHQPVKLTGGRHQREERECCEGAESAGQQCLFQGRAAAGLFWGVLSDLDHIRR